MKNDTDSMRFQKNRKGSTPMLQTKESGMSYSKILFVLV